uniref:ATP synthase F0 subunit 8 n=1 Tax=Fulvia mutica TaxID=80828 RepID=T2HGK6_FULMU|nr:ATP synthase F0 subunit 8 [Fulvia mutica]BAN79052.1 ATP synthase F0 subunit 8 [Fulvia mutica]
MAQFSTPFWVMMYLSVISSVFLFIVVLWWSGKRRYNF